MAAGNIFFYIFTALVAVNLIFAEDSLFSDDSQVDFSDDSQVDFDEIVSRQERSPNEDAEDRFFWNWFPLVTTCNYTATPGSSCASCRQAQQCLTSNTAIVRYCRGFLPFCNNGRCSFYPASGCNTTLVG